MTSVVKATKPGPSKLTPELQEQILTAIRKGGCTYADACLKVGISTSVFQLLSVTVAPSLGAVSRHGAEFAVEDLGPVHGRQVDLGDPVDTSCSPEGGREGALGLIGDPQVAGVIGTNCSAFTRPWRRRPSSATRAWS